MTFSRQALKRFQGGFMNRDIVIIMLVVLVVTLACKRWDH